MKATITRRAGGAIDLNGWHDPAKRVKRLQVIQGVALVLACAVSVVVVLFLARAFDSSSARQEHAYAQLRQLTDVRAMMRDQQVQLVQRVAAGKSPATPSFFADYARFRALALSLSENNAGGSGADARAARTAVTDAIAALDAGIQQALTNPARTLEIANSLQGPGSPGEQMEAGMDRWLDAASTRVTTVVADGNAFTADLLRWVVAIVVALGLSGLLLWLGLDRARSRLVGTLQRSEQRFRALVKYSSDTVMIIDDAGVIRYASEPAFGLCGYGPDELLGKPLHELVDPRDGSRIAQLASNGVISLQADEPIEWNLRHRDGSVRQVETICSTQIDDVVIDGFVLNTRDVTDRREMEKKLEHRAFHDVLTDLANRALFEDRVNHALTVAGPEAGMVAVMVLDLDDFKTVNDSLGHSAGDMLLVEAANRLRATLRATDTAARLGGDEFALLIGRAGGLRELTELADRIMATLREPIRIGGRDLVMRASLGIATATDASTSAVSLLRDADLAMYVAKGRRQAGHAVFDPSMAQAASDRLGLISALNVALERDEISLVYQPIVDLQSGVMVGAEALMRWNGSEHGSVEPSVFVPIAEETGLITTLGTWALRRRWRQPRGGLRLISPAFRSRSTSRSANSSSPVLPTWCVGGSRRPDYPPSG